MRALIAGAFLIATAAQADDEWLAESGAVFNVDEVKPEDYSLDRNPFYSIEGIAGKVEFWLVGGQIEVRCDEKAREISPRACQGARDIHEEK